MLPTANAFTKTPAERPDGNLGEDVAYTKADFDDSSWRKLDLPHDWGIEGPFKQEGTLAVAIWKLGRSSEGHRVVWLDLPPYVTARLSEPRQHRGVRS